MPRSRKCLSAVAPLDSETTRYPLVACPWPGHPHPAITLLRPDSGANGTRVIVAPLPFADMSDLPRQAVVDQQTNPCFSRATAKVNVLANETAVVGLECEKRV